MKIYNAGVQVMLFRDRLEVWNPGTLPSTLTLEKLRGPHAFVPHNPLLAEPMYLTKYIERMGTGIRDMIRRCSKTGLAEPEIIRELTNQPAPDQAPADWSACDAQADDRFFSQVPNCGYWAD